MMLILTFLKSHFLFFFLFFIFFIEDAKDRGEELGVVSFYHVHRSQNELARYVAHKALENQESSILPTVYPE